MFFLVLIFLFSALCYLDFDHNRQTQMDKGLEELYSVEYRKVYPISD